jgi:hypothetical protein
MADAKNFQLGGKHFEFSLKKNAALDFRFIDRIQNNHKLLSAEMSARHVKLYFVVLT